MRTPRASAVLVLGLSLLAAAASHAQVLATIDVNDDRLQGTDPTGFLALFTPDPVQPGSSISHWDSAATPNLLMEPTINADLPFLELDVTPGQMQDIGWSFGTSSFQILNLDPDGVGFTDPRPFAGAPGNPATTLGEARINLFNAVLAAWANTLDSDVEIEVEVTWQPLPCEMGGGAVLAGATTILIFQSEDFPRPGVWYPSALAEAFAGENLSEDDGDIFVIINSDIDEACLGPGTGYYYGLDGENPANQVDVAPVVLHEVGHGLGFANYTDERDGELVQGDPSIFDLFTFDTVTGQTWAEMTGAERVAEATRFRRVVWNGPAANAAAQMLLEPGVPELVVASPPEAAGTYEIGLASFGAAIPDGGLAAEIACMLDDTALDPNDTPFNGCSPAANSEELTGKIALIDRGLCNFTAKAANAQAAGAVAAVIVNTAGNSPVNLGGADPSITIPAISVGQADGLRIRQAACGGTAIFLNDQRFQVVAQWTDFEGQSGEGQGALLTDDTGYFRFFGEQNVELVVKVLDACDLEGFNNFWVFIAGLTNVEVTLTVTDTQTNQTRAYTNPLGQAFLPVQDTSAFATCP
jgi:hypothetical protein